ncbi:ABC transporter substrate-binding protein [Allofustis seminis]|uniref:ABC transporter substrate-binding protein n=1 Tax=Allofustis seminis TaxID=166939 RepID=UPI0003610081|nr:NrtA/SsuA/CpmA family ABC transporter substrate-binding protein [Allofustis seminis]
MKNLFKRLGMALMIVVLAVGLVACGGNAKDKKSATEDEKALGIDHLAITYVTSPLNVPSIVDKNEAFFEAELPGVAINYEEITSGADQTAALASGDVQLLHCVGGTSVIAAAAAGVDIKIINLYARAPQAYTLFTTDESINTPEDLRGKTIAGPTGTNLHEMLIAYLKTAGMTIEEVNYVNMPIPEAQAALEAGSIDGALLGGASGYKAKEAGLHLVTDGEGLIAGTMCVATSQAFIDEHPQVIKAITAAQEKMRQFMTDSADKAKEMTMKELGIDAKAYDAMITQYNFDMDVSDEDIKGLQATADFMLATGMIKEAIQVEELFVK